MPEEKNVYLMGEHLKRNVKFRPSHEFLVDWVTGKGERRLTYKQVAENVYRLCWALKDLGIKKGDMVAYVAYNSLEKFESILASALIGYVYGCQNPDLPEDWLVTIINDRMAAKVVFFDNEYREKVKKMMSRLKTVQYCICFDGSAEGDKLLNYRELISKYEPEEVEIEPEPDDLKCLYMTSGTTGIPKGAMWTHRADYWGAFHLMITCDYGTEDVAFFCLPGFFSIAYQAQLEPVLLVGGTLVVLDGKMFRPGALELFCEATDKERIKAGVVPAAWWLELAKWPEEKCKQYNLSSLVPGVWGITVPYPAWKTIYDRWGIIGLKVGMATAEAVGGVALNASSMLKLLKEEKKEPLSSYGHPFGSPYLVRLVDNEGNEVAPGEVGEAIIKSPAMAHGYLGEPERWAKKYKDGWYYTGDLFSIDESGFFYLEVKKEDIGMCPVDKDGKYVLPYRIQDAVAGIENVVEASVISVSDPEFQAKYRIVVRPVEGVELSADEVLKVTSKLVPDYLIKDVIIRKEPIPKTATGKISVRTLAEEYGGIIPEE